MVVPRIKRVNRWKVISRHRLNVCYGQFWIIYAKTISGYAIRTIAKGPMHVEYSAVVS